MIAQLSSKERALLWTLGACRQMRAWGLMAGDDIVTTRGLAVWDQLDAEWKPSDDELRAVVFYVIAPAAECIAQADICAMLTEFRDNRARMQEHVARQAKKKPCVS